MEVVQIISQERISETTSSSMSSTFLFRNSVPDVTVFFHESVQQLTVEQIMHVPLPQFVEDVVEVIQTFPPDLLFQRIVLQIVDALVL